MSTIEMIQLAEHRNQEHAQRLKTINSHTKYIYHTILDNDEAMFTRGIMKEIHYKHGIQTAKELSSVIVESRHHIKRLEGLLRETPEGELRDRLIHIINSSKPKTDETLSAIDAIIKSFNRLSHYNKR